MPSVNLSRATRQLVTHSIILLPNTAWILLPIYCCNVVSLAGSTTVPCPGSCVASPPFPCWYTSLVHRLNSCRSCGGMRQQWTSWWSCWIKTLTFRTIGVCGTTVSPSTCTHTSGSQQRCTTKDLASKINPEYIYIFIYSYISVSQKNMGSAFLDIKILTCEISLETLGKSIGSTNFSLIPFPLCKTSPCTVLQRHDAKKGCLL